MSDTDILCPCGKGKSLTACCGPLIQGDVTAKTPEQLMRSRYTAYALGGCGEYLLRTWFPATAGGLDAASLSLSENKWVRLEILNKSQQGDDGVVEFNAYYQAADGKEAVMHEISEFTRAASRWFYVGGRVS